MPLPLRWQHHRGMQIRRKQLLLLGEHRGVQIIHWGIPPFDPPPLPPDPPPDPELDKEECGLPLSDSLGEAWQCNSEADKGELD
ncbi:hypothetical protein NMY22_g6873 [Coprinellus aureogranulatus]|nr:hypothetical protein NMY22_g6873 [Coprinellus aureogranulatus]